MFFYTCDKYKKLTIYFKFLKMKKSFPMFLEIENG